MESVTPNEMLAALRLFKDVSRDYNANSLSRELDVTPMGALKILKKLEKQGILKSKTMGRAVFYKPDLESRLAKSFLAFLLQKEAEESPPQVKKWVTEARKLRGNAEAAIVFGSALGRNEPGDIDLLLVLSQPQNRKLNALLDELNEVNVKRIHTLKQSKKDLTENIRQKNETILNALKEGVVAFGQDTLVEVMRDAAQ